MAGISPLAGSASSYDSMMQSPSGAFGGNALVNQTTDELNAQKKRNDDLLAGGNPLSSFQTLASPNAPASKTKGP